MFKTPRELHGEILTQGHRTASPREKQHGSLDAFLRSRWLRCGIPNGYTFPSARLSKARADRGDILIPNCEIVLVPAEPNLQIVVLGDEFQNFNLQLALDDPEKYPERGDEQ